MDCVVGNVVPFRRINPAVPQAAPGTAEGTVRRRSDQRALMDAVYATGGLTLAAGDREAKLTASRLQVYGFLAIEEIGAAGEARRLRPSEAIRARVDRPWRLSKPAFGGLPVTIPAVDTFLFEPQTVPA